MTAEAAIDPRLEDAVLRIARTDRLLVAMDFDGTMSPLVSRAQDARPLPAAAAAFAALAGLEGTTAALVSGRALASLRAVAAPPEQALLVGSHGAEVWLGPDSPGLELDNEQELALQRAVASVQKAVDAHPGTVLERKPAGVVLHYRQAAAQAAAAAVAEVRQAAEGQPGLFLSEGKMVLEISVVRADKGQSLAMLRGVTRATAVIFAGDDVTDEHGFSALHHGDVGIKVGPGDSSARFRLESPRQLPAVLELLAAARARWKPAPA
ncbi:trehalose-phosphatase [Arthrobacter sp. A2-55]|uniref:trehalose-phosphatase n=1 Tax=Arthrobacter sp. A2-55 TaxID=2897337 RepID=UPI0021CD5691|nr:trehalose-phosphatase [Arthrobacter sp. A2-55]MCU6482336.1 trehalose-phosphatase [Arthrobacter sp. A2-55]